MDFSVEDGKRLWSLLWNKEVVLQKKRRWLMQSESINEQKRFKRPKFVNDLLAESCSDNKNITSVKPTAKVPDETLRSTVERSFGSFSNEERCLVVQKCLLPFCIPENKNKLSRRFLSMMGNLTNDALSTVVHIVANKQDNLGRIKMQKIIKHHFPLFLENQRNISSSLEHLLEILTRPGNFREITSKNICKHPWRFLSMMGNLNDDALLTVAHIVTKKKVDFQRNRTKMKKVIKDHLPLFLKEESDISSGSSTRKKKRFSSSLIEQLPDILRRPDNFLDRLFKIGTPVSEALLTSITKNLERINEMSFQELKAMNRKFRGVSMVPQFPVGCESCDCSTKDLLLERIKQRYKKFLNVLKEGDYMPNKFAKALSVMHLSMRLRLQTTDIPDSGVFPFSPKIVLLQNDIITALWSLSKIKSEKLKALHAALDPEGRVPTIKFKIALRKYLIEYLFECDEMKPPKEAVVALDILNRKRQSQIPILSEEVEAVMSFSCQLRKFVVSLLPNILENEHGDASLDEDSDEGKKTDAFDLSAADYFSLGGYEKSYDESDSNTVVEHSQDSRSAVFTSSTAMAKNSPNLADVSSQIIVDKANSPEMQYDNDRTTNLSFKEPMNHCHQITGYRTERSIEDISNETALAAYRLVGRMLDKLIVLEGKNADVRTRTYPDGGVLPSQVFQAREGSSSDYNSDEKSHILLEAIQELVPTFPESFKRGRKIILSCTVA